MSLGSSFLKEAESFAIILCNAFSSEQQVGEVIFSHWIAGIGGLLVEVSGFWQILFHPKAVVVKVSQIVLRAVSLAAAPFSKYLRASE